MRSIITILRYNNMIIKYNNNKGVIISNNRTVPNKDCTYGKFGWKKIIVHVQLLSI